MAVGISPPFQPLESLMLLQVPPPPPLLALWVHCWFQMCLAPTTAQALRSSSAAAPVGSLPTGRLPNSMNVDLSN